ncbi:MAG TPA: alpha/beta fold hydrolase [Acidimicrobiia bacterium]|nr:alpha/beta fold hydrolase [Acidimicrobiia bacterium]
MTDEPRSPLELLEALAVQEVELAPQLGHLEVYTMRGLLTLLWHGARDAPNIVLTCGGGMGSLLGPADGLYHRLGMELAPLGIPTIRVGYRKPNDLSRCVHDVAAAGDLAGRSGARQFIVMGHSFGGAVAVQAAIVFGEHCRGVVTLSTQSAGCEHASEIGDTPLLLFHGTDDIILPPETSAVVQMLAGHGEIVMLPGADHLLTQASEEIAQRLLEWIPARFDGSPHEHA